MQTPGQGPALAAAGLPPEGRHAFSAGNRLTARVTEANGKDTLRLRGLQMIAMKTAPPFGETKQDRNPVREPSEDRKWAGM